MLRLFVAVDLPAELRDEVAGLRIPVTGARWANPKQLHITLRFLGATAEDALPDVQARLATVSQRAFRLRLCGTGVFPEARAGQPGKPPKVLWLGLEPAHDLARLKRAVDTALAADAEAQPFAPHLTLARFSARPDPTLSGFLSKFQGYTSAYGWVRSFHLYQSTLRREGALHACVASYPLTEPGE